MKEPEEEIFNYLTGHFPDDVFGYENLWGEYCTDTTLEKIKFMLDYFMVDNAMIAGFFVYMKIEED